MKIGKKLKELRTQNGLTLEELANRSELTKGFLSQLERDLTSPNISALENILEALGTNLADFFQSSKEEQIVFHTQDFFVNEQDDLVTEYIIPNAQKNQMEPLLLTLKPGAKSQEVKAHEGEEFGYILKGSVVLVVGNKRLKVKSKETFYITGILIDKERTYMEQEKNKLIQFRHIVKEFDGQVVLKGIDLDIYENEFVTLLGPSGCGKTTLLRILGGFLEPSEGQVILNGEDICEVPAYKRELNTVFQKYALFPHMNVYDNIAFGLKIKKMSKDVIDQKVMKMLKLIGLEGFENKDVTLLSGGQQQRVAIARALVNEPSVLLLDEPLSALDLKLRKEMQYELKKIQQEVGITFIFVTHDQEEALTMSDKIVIMKDGEIQQVGSPEDIYNEPVNQYVAKFIGESNIIPARMVCDKKVRFDDITFDCVDVGYKENEPVDVVIRPEDIDIVDVKDGKMTGEVESVLFKGVHYEIMVETVPGTHVTVNMHVNKNYAITSEDGKEKISANDFYLDLEDMKDIDDKEIIARADAQAWNPETDEFISIHDIDTDLKQEVGEYTVTFSTNNKTSITRKIWVVDQRVVENKKANEAVSAFNFFKTVDEIKESMAIDTDLKTWANAQGWKLDDENETVDLDVDYDFDPETIKEGIYKVTFWTTGREFKIHTTDYVEEGKEVGLTFFAEDIHVMEKMGF